MATDENSGQEHDPKRIYTAWELCADWWWTQEYYCRVVGGRTLYWEAAASQTHQSVLLMYLQPTVDHKLHQVTRYVDRETKMELVPQDAV